MLLVFYLDVAYVCKFFQVFFQVFQKHVSSVLFAFRRILQVLHLDVLKIDRVLHLSSSPSAASPRCLLLLLAPVRHPPPSPPLLDAGDVRDSAGPAWVHKTAREMDCGARAFGRPVHPDVRVLANPKYAPTDLAKVDRSLPTN
jgi:hypothetical protein